ncbi:preprotein translocase subunit SecE [Candidatus Jorgensenbacteria bacterium]|nr:preprotein translocase subunit SecE [Candidatus Jorgensenbacteria bacterium]
MWQKIKVFFDDSRQEFKRVNWPTFQETKRYTIFVIVLSLGLALFLGLLDFLFLQILQQTVFKI